ncbi:phosphoglycolate phosphatase [Granulosicoccaceae sp. 1_MG-2023]|nr:phosphoglycolate phosphatase [Granulosicoccaceae sp. 1_MG-2023]
MRLSRPQAILFDLDGTLVDSLPDLAFALDSTLLELGLPAAGLDKVSNWVGNGIERLVKRGLTGDMQAEPDAALLAAALAHFRRIYAQQNGRRSVLFDGAREGLQDLHKRGIALGIVTNKATQFTGPLLAAMDIDRFFSVVVCGDTLDKCKPEPEPLWHALSCLDVPAAQSWMVGDSRHDMAAARAAGMTAVAVPYGYNHGEAIESAAPDLLVSSIRELAERVPDDRISG